MYLDYIKERENLSTLEIDGGFVLYKYDGDICFMSDLYIQKDYRGKKMSHELANMLCDMAKAHGSKQLACQVDLTANDVEASLGTIISYGFKVLKGYGYSNIITFTKEIE